jgi:hypothetical protein
MSWGTDQQGYGQNHPYGTNYGHGYGYEHGQQPYPAQQPYPQAQEPYPQQYVDHGQVDYGQADYGQADYGQADYGQVDYGEQGYVTPDVNDTKETELPETAPPESEPQSTPEAQPEAAPAARKRAGRDRYFDTLRAVALVRVVTYHTFGWAWAGMVFPSMGIMFALAGTLMAKSLERPALTVIRSRVRRLLPPFWFWGFFVIVAMMVHDWMPGWQIVFWVVPLGDPPGNAWGAAEIAVGMPSIRTM